MTDFRMPKLNNNDSHYVLVEWLVADGGRVRPGDAVATVETSKAVEDLVTEAWGVLRHHVAAHAEYAPGEVLGRVEQPDQPAAAPVAEQAPEPTGIVVTAPAQARMAELGIASERLRRLGKRVIRREDVDRLVALEETDAPARDRQELSRHQHAVAATVSRSHAEIPPAYLAVRVDVGEALELVTRLRAELRLLVGLADLLVVAVARQHAHHPLCFAAIEEGSVVLPDRPNVGITVDMGTGLYVPVVTNAASRSIAEVTELVAGFRDTALRDRFRAAELSGANIMVALHTHEDVLFGIPIVFPGHAAALSLSATRQELSLLPDGTVAARQVVTLGMTHDHRLVNGQDASQFLRAVKGLLEKPEELTEPP